MLGGISPLGGVAGKKIKNVVSQGIRKAITNQSVINALDTVAGLVTNMAGEGIEEYLQEILDPVFRNITLGENNDFKPITPEAIEAGIIGALIGGIFDAPQIGSALNSTQNENYNIRNAVNDLKTYMYQPLSTVLTQHGLNQNTAELQAKTIAKIISGERVGSSEIASLIHDGGEAARNVIMQQTGTDIGTTVDGAAAAIRSLRKDKYASQSTGVRTAEYNGSQIEIEGVSKNTKNGLKVDIKAADGSTETVNAALLTFSDENTKMLYDIAENYDGKMDVHTYASTFYHAYKAGFYGTETQSRKLHRIIQTSPQEPFSRLISRGRMTRRSPRSKEQKLTRSTRRASSTGNPEGR